MDRRRFCTCALLLAVWATGSLAAGRSSARVAAGTKWATPYHVQDTGQPGPTVLIVGGVHGNEPAGARAAAQIRHWPLTRGKLVVVPRANEPGLRANKRLMPTTTDRDLNRNFPRAADEEPRGELAAALWALVSRIRPDWCLDLHEGFGFRKQTRKTTGSSIIILPEPATKAQAERMLEAANATVADEDKKLVLLRGPARGSLARAVGEWLGAHAMIVETTYGGQPLSLRTRQHRLMVHRLLIDLGMISCGPDVMMPLRRRRGEIRVALYDSTGTGPGPRILDGKLRGAEGVRLARIGPAAILTGALSQFDVLIIPGGSASRQAKAITREGREGIRRFVRNGGGYWGSCAGAYLAASNYSWSLRILDADVIDRSHWKRGKGTVRIELTAEGRRVLGDRQGLVDIRYANGPLLAPAERPEIPDFTALARYRTEINKAGAPEGVMIDTPAIAAGRWGRGRVVVTSAHPEYTRGLEPMVRRLVRWAAGQQDGVAPN